MDKYIDDPDCGFVCSNSLWLDFIYGCEMVLRESTYINLNKNIKIFLAGGADDPCISNGDGIDGLYHYFNKSFKNVRVKKFKEMRHEIQNESCKDELLSSMENCLNS